MSDAVKPPTVRVDFVRDDLATMIPTYELIRDCIDGERAVKTARDRWLPVPNAEDTSAAALARYEHYLARAVFYNVTGRTLLGMSGLLYLQPPEVKLSSRLGTLEKNADGAG